MKDYFNQTVLFNGSIVSHPIMTVNSSYQGFITNNITDYIPLDLDDLIVMNKSSNGFYIIQGEYLNSTLILNVNVSFRECLPGEYLDINTGFPLCEVCRAGTYSL